MKTKTYTSIEKVHPSFKEASEVLVQIFTALIDAESIEATLARVKEILPHACIIGMTVDMSIDKGRLLRDETLFIVSRFEKSRVKSMLLPRPDTDFDVTKNAFVSLAAATDQPPKTAIVLANAFAFDSDRLMRSISQVLPMLTIAGGLASDHRTFSQTYVFTEEGISGDGVATAMLYGETLQVGTHFDLNWRGLGKKFTVTSAKGNRLYTLDNEPAIDIYRRYLGPEVYAKLPRIGLEFPLLFQDGNLPVARAVMQVHDDGSLSFAGGIAEGKEVQFGFADIENLLDDPNRHHGILASQSVESIFIYSCIARYTLIGKEIEAETLQMQHIATTAGAFTYGEFFHDASMGCNRVFNQTMTALALSEGGTPRLEQKIQRRRTSAEATYGRVLSHFMHEMTGELERAYEAEKRSKEMMVQQSRQASMGEIIEMIAHQWRQPLNIAALGLQDIYIKAQLGTLDNEVLESLYGKVNASIQYLSQTIDDFRDFMKPDIKPEPFEMQALFNEVELLMSGVLKKYNVALGVENDSCELVSRKNELMQVLLNLMNNAVDAMRGREQKDGRLQVLCRRRQASVVIEICDNAGGIDPAILDRIFEPYFTTKSEQNGTGLGLYIASQIVEKNLHGTLGVRNREDGACFTIVLPLQST